MHREKLSSRLGFLLLSAGCAIGLGNVWRFPYIVGKYGGAVFVLIYLLFLVILGLPVMVMEFSVGRASQQSAARSFRVLEPEGSKWHLMGGFAVVGNYLLMMFYTVVGGWMLAYFVKTVSGAFDGLNPDAVKAAFDQFQAQPLSMVFWMGLAVALGFFVCSLGLQRGVERVTKWMMSGLFVLLIILCVRSLLLSGAREGLSFYLLPDLARAQEAGMAEVVTAAMGQAFFTLSTGIGSLAIFGSYLGREQRLTGEAVRIAGLDTGVALLVGLIIFPACFTFGVDATQGPGLVFVTLPNLFNQMPGGRVWGSLFFLFMSFAALSTIIAVFENILSFGMDLWGWSRRKAVVINVLLVFLLSLPCALGYNLWNGIMPFGPGSNIGDLEDFLVSNNFLPLGSLVYVVFCTSRYGWGWKNFLGEANTGEGLRFPRRTRLYVAYGIPVLILILFVMGYWQKFS